MNPPTPTVIRKAFGNPGHRPLNENEPMPDAGAVMPEHFNEKGFEEAKKEWERLAPMLEKAGLLTVVDADALEMYCEAYARWRHANRQIAKYGVMVRTKNSTFPVPSPYLPIANRAFDQMKQMINEFGMTPSSRTRVSVTPTNKPKSRLRDALGGGG